MPPYSLYQYSVLDFHFLEGLRQMEGTRMIENIHEGVETTPTHEYEEVVLVTGKYWFCHFGQQDFDDSVRSSKRRDI